MPPFRCCPDAHVAHNFANGAGTAPNVDVPDNCEAQANKTWDVIIAETWKQGPSDDISNAVDAVHGNYTCTELSAVQIPFKSDSWYKGSYAVGYTQGHDDATASGTYTGLGSGREAGEDGAAERKRREDATFSAEEGEEPSDDGERGAHLLAHTTNHTANGYGGYGGSSYGGNAYDNKIPITYYHGYYGKKYGPGYIKDPVHPGWVTGKETVCTLMCPAGEVSATGYGKAVCQVVNGVNKWIIKITNCVNADDMLAELKAPTEDNEGRQVVQAAEETAAVQSAPSDDVADDEKHHHGGGHDDAEDSKKKGKKDKKKKEGKDKEAKKKKKAEKKKKKEGKKDKKKKKKDKKKEKAAELLGLDGF